MSFKENCYWYHEGKENDCWFEHESCDHCGDYEPMDNDSYIEWKESNVEE